MYGAGLPNSVLLVAFVLYNLTLCQAESLFFPSIVDLDSAAKYIHSPKFSIAMKFFQQDFSKIFRSFFNNLSQNIAGKFKGVYDNLDTYTSNEILTGAYLFRKRNRTQPARESSKLKHGFENGSKKVSGKYLQANETMEGNTFEASINQSGTKKKIPKMRRRRIMKKPRIRDRTQAHVGDLNYNEKSGGYPNSQSGYYFVNDKTSRTNIPIRGNMVGVLLSEEKYATVSGLSPFKQPDLDISGWRESITKKTWNDVNLPYSKKDLEISELNGNVKSNTTPIGAEKKVIDRAVKLDGLTGLVNIRHLKASSPETMGFLTESLKKETFNFTSTSTVISSPEITYMNKNTTISSSLEESSSNITISASVHGRSATTGSTTFLITKAPLHEHPAIEKTALIGFKASNDGSNFVGLFKEDKNLSKQYKMNSPVKLIMRKDEINSWATVRPHQGLMKSRLRKRAAYDALMSMIATRWAKANNEEAESQEIISDDSFYDDKLEPKPKRHELLKSSSNNRPRFHMETHNHFDHDQLSRHDKTPLVSEIHGKISDLCSSFDGIKFKNKSESPLSDQRVSIGFSTMSTLLTTQAPKLKRSFSDEGKQTIEALRKRKGHYLNTESTSFRSVSETDRLLDIALQQFQDTLKSIIKSTWTHKNYRDLPHKSTERYSEENEQEEETMEEAQKVLTVDSSSKPVMKIYADKFSRAPLLKGTVKKTTAIMEKATLNKITPTHSYLMEDKFKKSAVRRNDSLRNLGRILPIDASSNRRKVPVSDGIMSKILSSNMNKGKLLDGGKSDMNPTTLSLFSHEPVRKRVAPNLPSVNNAEKRREKLQINCSTCDQSVGAIERGIEYGNTNMTNKGIHQTSTAGQIEKQFQDHKHQSSRSQRFSDTTSLPTNLVDHTDISTQQAFTTEKNTPSTKESRKNNEGERFTPKTHVTRPPPTRKHVMRLERRPGKSSGSPRSSLVSSTSNPENLQRSIENFKKIAQLNWDFFKIFEINRNFSTTEPDHDILSFPSFLDDHSKSFNGEGDNSSPDEKISPLTEINRDSTKNAVLTSKTSPRDVQTTPFQFLENGNLMNDELNVSRQVLDPKKFVSEFNYDSPLTLVASESKDKLPYNNILNKPRIHPQLPKEIISESNGNPPITESDVNYTLKGRFPVVNRHRNHDFASRRLSHLKETHDHDIVQTQKNKSVKVPPLGRVYSHTAIKSRIGDTFNSFSTSRPNYQRYEKKEPLFQRENSFKRAEDLKNDEISEEKNHIKEVHAPPMRTKNVRFVEKSSRTTEQPPKRKSEVPSEQKTTRKVFRGNRWLDYRQSSTKRYDEIASSLKFNAKHRSEGQKNFNVRKVAFNTEDPNGYERVIGSTEEDESQNRVTQLIYQTKRNQNRLPSKTVHHDELSQTSKTFRTKYQPKKLERLSDRNIQLNTESPPEFKPKISHNEIPSIIHRRKEPRFRLISRDENRDRRENYSNSPKSHFYGRERAMIRVILSAPTEKHFLNDDSVIGSTVATEMRRINSINQEIQQTGISFQSEYMKTRSKKREV